jgi:hypothetical protein
MRALLPILCCLFGAPWSQGFRLAAGLPPGAWSVITSGIFNGAAFAVIVDRIAITVGNKVITDSEIDLRIRLTAFENGEKPDFSPAARRVAANRLIDQKLVEHEMDVGHYPRLKAETTAPDTAARDKELAQYGLTPADLEQDLARQADLLNFLNLRFRPSVQVSDQDVRQYFDKQAQPAGPGQVTLNDMRAQIEQRIAGQRADAEMDTWLKDQRKGTTIVYLEKDLAP